MIVNSPVTVVRPSLSSTRRVRSQNPVNGKVANADTPTAKTTKKVVLRLECVECKTKAQLALKRCKHFELGYGPTALTEPQETATDSYTVETRRPRVPLLFSRCRNQIWLFRSVVHSFSLPTEASGCHGYKTNLSPFRWLQVTNRRCAWVVRRRDGVCQVILCIVWAAESTGDIFTSKINRLRYAVNCHPSNSSL